MSGILIELDEGSSLHDAVLILSLQFIFSGPQLRCKWLLFVAVCLSANGRGGHVWQLTLIVAVDIQVQLARRLRRIKLSVVHYVTVFLTLCK